MPLENGRRLGPYQIEAPLGAGGMGEVYKATDTRLDRIVAIKVLPEHVAADPALKQRFEREAKTLAGLSHPHICPVFDVGTQDGIDFLVMEYLDGETLAQRLETGALPLDQALQVAIEIADALDKAHRQGIVHRDLKPGNIMLTKTGAKLLDFGLAKPTAMAMGADSAMPTMSEGLTGQGAILGTLQYMAPEQLEGEDVDARTDVFAFGTTVYEMITGSKAFESKSQASLITAIMSATPPPLTEAQPLSPPLLDRVVRKCFAKEPDERWQTTKDLRDELRWVSEPVEGTEPAPQTGHWRRLAWVAVGTVALVAAALMSQFRTTESQPPQPTFRYQVTPGGANLGVFGTAAASGGLTVSPDGRHFAFVATDSDGTQQLWIQPLDQLSARPLEGTEGARSPFWAADSRSVAFFAQARLKSLDVATSTIRELGPTSIRGTSAGGSWSPDGTILFHTATGLSRMSASGGAPTSLTLIDPERGTLAHRWPAFLPDGRRFIFLVMTDSDETNGLYMASLDSPEPEFLVASDSSGVYAEPGFLLFVRAGVLFAQPFDAERGEVSGEPIPVANDVPVTQSRRRAEFAVSDTGVLIYGARSASARLAWFDRSGSFLGEFEGNSHAEISPDGLRVAADVLGESGTRDVWVWDLVRGGRDRITSDVADDWVAVWSPDGDRIIFTSDRNDPRAREQLYETPAGGGSGDATLLLETDEGKHHLAWSPNGDTLAFESLGPETSWDLWTLSLGGDPEPTVFLKTEFQEAQPQFSPDGRYLAYASNETGTFEVYLQTFPPGNERWPVSTAGGVQPRWTQNGRELLYLGADAMIMSVVVDLSTFPPALGVPQPVFQTVVPGGAASVHFAVTPDGERFLSYSPREQTAFTVVVNWFEELRAPVPSGQ